MTTKKAMAPWKNPADAPVIEQSIHDLIVSIFRLSPHDRDVEIIPISPGAEAKRGWDAAVMQVAPLFLQYKLPDFTSKPKSTQKIVYAKRKSWHFDDERGLFHFRLRAKAKGEPRSQHELLVDLEQQGERVFYVAPTFIDFRRLRRGGELIEGNPWVNSQISILHAGLLEKIEAPLFKDLICIPPYSNVDGQPEDHQFFFNDCSQVSLHSNPLEIPSMSFRDLITDQVERVVSGRDTINGENREEFVCRVLEVLAKGSEGSAKHGSVRRFFEANLVQQNGHAGNHWMRDIRALAQVVRKLTGIQMMLTVFREV